MLLKSSSTPILGSLLSSYSPFFSKNPKNGFQVHHYQSLEGSISSSSVIHAISNCSNDSHHSQRPPKKTSSSSSFRRRTENKGVDQNPGKPLFIEKGFGQGFLINFGDESGFNGGGDGRDGNYAVKSGYGGEGYYVELQYERMIVEESCNPLILRNYARFLHQGKGELERAEEYYSRAILCDPCDADAISQYGKLVWELHRDYERASNYLECAANMDQNNCFVQAAYASFLWETCEEDKIGQDNNSQRF